MQSTFRPLDKLAWGQPFTPDAERRSRWTFKVGFEETLSLLERELDYLGAERFVIEADFRERDLRRDGSMPLASARVPEFPGVRVAFDSDHGPLIYQSDVCEIWQHNLRSIALGLEALRAVSRFGISGRDQQYTGFLQIGAATAMPAGGWMTEEQATEVVYKYGRCSKDIPLLETWRFAQRRAHPDHGGTVEDWQELEAAGKSLGLLDEKGHLKR